MRIPPILTAGDSATWRDDAFGDALGASVDSSVYTLTYSLRGPVAGAAADLVGTASGTGWSFVLASAQSAALNTGSTAAKWYWGAYASKAGGVRLTAGTGTLNVRPNLAGISGVSYDGRSANEQTLAAINAEIDARINGGATLEYSIGTRSLKKEPMSALLELQSRYQLRVSRERRAQQIANGLGNPQRLGVRFGVNK